VHGGRRREWRGRLVNPPVERASTILFDSVADLKRNRPQLGTYRYALQGTATQWALAEALTDLEAGAAGTALYSSGLAAITAPLMTVLGPGDELLVPDNVYGPTRHFCDTFLKRYGVATRYYDPLIGKEIGGLVSERTRAILLESPGSLTMEVQDVPGVCAVARDRDLVTLLDNTWATPLLFPAISHGVDITILAATKYVGGHADVMLGSATATADHYDRLQHVSWDLGHSVSPDDAWLGSRGLRTMGVRLKQHEESALKIAEWLKGRLNPLLHDMLDENMVVVRGDRRTADIYATEFNRIFNHYYFRSVTEATAGEPQSVLDASLFLSEDDSWEQKYAPGTLKSKRLALYQAMTGFTRA